nr:ribonuclease H-like domain-containing protein [Tanacetum cinerariifolium]
MARLVFCDYHNMIAILEKYEHNVDFYQIVDFVKASHIRYALTINPTVYVSYIQQFWSTARIETTNEGTKILAIVDGKPRTISKSSIRRNLKLNDECLSPKSTGFNEFSSNIATAMGEGSGTPTEPHHTPSPEAQQSPQHDLSSSIHPPVTTATIPTVIPTEIPTLRENIIHSSTLPYDSTPRVTSLVADEGKDATIKGRSLEIGEEAAKEKSTKSGISVPPAAEVATVSIPTGSGMVPTASPIFTTASGVTPYSRRKGKEKMVESDTLKNKKLQEQIDVQVAREMEEQIAKEDQRMNEQIARDAEIARIHAEEELQMLIDRLYRSNETIAKYLQEYEQYAVDLSIEERIDMINELVKYQDHYAKGMSLEEIREKFILVWKQIEDFFPMASKEEGERFKRKGLRLEQDSAKKVKELWVELKRLYEPDVEDQLWTYTQALMHDPMEWRLYVTCGVHHELSRDQEIFIDEFPLLDYFPTASEDRFTLLSERDALAEEVCTADEVKIGIQSQCYRELGGLAKIITRNLHIDAFRNYVLVCNGHVSVTTDTQGMIKVLPPKTAKEVVARERKRKARTTLLMALPEDHLAKFHLMDDAKEMWEAIKSRFGGNDESKKMQKYLRKQQFEGFFVSSSKGLHKGYGRFQNLLSQLEIHGAGVSNKDANQNFDDLYNNLRVFKHDVKGTTASSSSNTQNIAFVSADNTSSTNDVSTVYSVSSHSVLKSQNEGSASYIDEVIHSFFANQSSAPQLDCDDLDQINDDDLEEMDLKWLVAMISMRIKKFHKRTKRKLQFDTKDPVGLYKTKVECFNYHKIGHFAKEFRAKGYQDNRRRDVRYNGNKARDNGRRPTYPGDSKALVTIDGEDIDFSGHVEEDTQNFAMMAYSSSNSSSDNNVQSYSKTCAGNYMPSGPDLEIDYSKFTYGPKQTSVDDSDAKPSENASNESDSSVKTTTSMPAPVENAPKTILSNVQEEIEKPSFAFTDSVKHVKTLKENVKESGTPNHYPKIKKQDRHSHTKKGMGYGFTRKACFVCDSFSHLIRDCDFHEKRMAKQAALTKSMNKITGQQEHRPVWNNVERVNHQNKFVPSVLLTKTGKITVNAARQNFSKQAALTSTASKGNIARPFVNETRPTRCFYKSHSPRKRPNYNKIAQRNTFSYHKVNTVNNSLSAVKEN